jgi:alpha-tubulin suppressor-like RCC1 family protein
VSIVEQSGPMDIILREAAQNGDYMIIKDLVSTGQASIEKRDASNGYTPLHYSCANGHLECVSTLLMLGADPSASTLTSANGCVTPLMLASQAGFDEIVALLLHHNSHVSERDSNNMRAYDHAAEMAIALKGVESGRRRDCEVILRVQDDPGDPTSALYPKRRVSSYADTEADVIVSIAAGGSTRVSAGFALSISGRGTLWGYGLNNKGQIFRGLDTTTEWRWRRSEDLRKYHRRVSACSAGGEHSLAILDTGHIVTAGSNYNGQLGTGDGKDVTVPQPLDLTVKATAVACGTHHSVVIMEGGVTLTFGLNRNGQLGTGDRSDRYSPVEIPTFQSQGIRFTRCEAGSAHTVWIDTNRNVWSCGRGLSAGHGSPGDIDDLKPMMIPDLKAITIACGEYHTLLIDDTKKRRLYSWGSGQHGCLGHSDRADQRKPKHVTMFTDKKVAKRSMLVSCAAGGKHSLVMTNWCDIYAFGDNSYGQLGRGDRKVNLLPRLLTDLEKYRPACPIAIAASGYHSFVALTDKRILHFGSVSRETAERRLNPDKLWPELLSPPDDDSDTEAERIEKEKKSGKNIGHQKKTNAATGANYGNSKKK